MGLTVAVRAHCPQVEYVLTKLSNGKLQAFRIKGENGQLAYLLILSPLCQCR